ncbi:MAG: hypothetical protein PHU06_07015 [Gallionella sp.]|nr:hypothetical protein [Gallionella sp.]MDD4958512.1 hypothetical protein [Gallionella sp.]
MSTSSNAFTLKIKQEHIIPFRQLSRDDKEYGELFKGYGDDDYYLHSSPDYYIQIIIHDFCRAHELVGLEYINEPYVILDSESIRKAIYALSYMLNFFESKPEETAEFLNGNWFSKEISKIMGLNLDELYQWDRDEGSFYELVAYIRNQLNLLESALTTNCFILSILHDCDNDWVDWINKRQAPKKPYSKELLNEVERILEQGINYDAVPFQCPKPDSMTFGAAREWYLKMVSTLPDLVKDITDYQKKIVAELEMKNTMRKAAIISLYDPHLAPAFFTSFQLPSIDDLLLEQAPRKNKGIE